MLTFAYIGPGAGFAVMGSFAILFVAVILGLLTLLSLPFRFLLGLFRRRPRGQFRRCVVLGFDGMDPRRAAALMDAGRLPHLARLRQTGTFAPLGSTCPPISPVAWSTFATGVNPGKHGIFDFLSRDLKTYLPELSSARIVAAASADASSAPDGRAWWRRLARRRRAARASATLLRHSRPFWHLLGERGVFSTILRVPITFPPERFRGLCLSAMCTPDIRGTQGEFTVFQSAPVAGATTGGRRVPVTVEAAGNGRRVVRASLPGPTLRGRETALQVEITWRVGSEGGRQGSGFRMQAELRFCGQRVRMHVGVYSPWVCLTFRDGFTRVHAIARFLLVATEPEFALYVTPINIDPERPALPVSWPAAYSVYLAKRQGPFATLGLAEDTWALTEGVINDAAFVQQVTDIHAEREAMFLNALRRTRRGLCVCVFDITDRIQHTFMRSAKCGMRNAEYVPSAQIDDAYESCDRLTGRALRMLGPRDALFVVSDHGFTAFRRCVNVNAWLREQGYLALKSGAGAEEYLRNVDWSKTRAYSFGLAGIYLNMQGREAQGTVAPGAAAQALKDEIAAKLRALRDPAHDRPAARQVYDAAQVYAGPYVANAPDLIVGWHSGYRHSWETAVGRTDGPVFADNTSAWCGDHCVDRAEVPGVIFCNRKLVLPERGPHLADLAPTLLSLWQVPVPGYMDGRAWKVE